MHVWDFASLWTYRGLFFSGAAITLGLTIAVVVLGLFLGLVAGLAQLSRFSALRGISWAYIEAFRCVPLLVQLLWFYHALPILTGIAMTAWTTAVLTLSLYGGSFYAGIIRDGILSIDKEQSEAGLALGMTPCRTMRRIALPQAIKRVIPSLMNQSIVQFRNTSLVSILAAPDLLYQGQAAAMDIDRPFEIYSLIAVLYFVILAPLTILVKRREKYLASSD